MVQIPYVFFVMIARDRPIKYTLCIIISWLSCSSQNRSQAYMCQFVANGTSQTPVTGFKGEYPRPFSPPPATYQRPVLDVSACHAHICCPWNISVETSVVITVINCRLDYRVAINDDDNSLWLRHLNSVIERDRCTQLESRNKQFCFKMHQYGPIASSLMQGCLRTYAAQPWSFPYGLPATVGQFCRL